MLGRIFQIVALLSLGLAAAEAQSQPEFGAAVQPILADRCYSCHDAATRKGGLALDTLEGIVVGSDSGAVLIAHDPDGSILFRRITSDDPDERMPPKGDSLTASQIETIRNWIESGAPMSSSAPGDARPESDWWAFQPPRQAPLPKVAKPEWVQTPLDAFVLARLEQTGLTPSPPADRYTLLRRVHLDLTGLPPTPAEIRAFVHDTCPDAYARVVERLLASPHYGERQAIPWLDAARYADTNGYEKDRHRSIWPYRDWVINAFNQDKPFDQFIIEQIAGDLLPNATQDQKIATGFLRNSLHNEEGGIDAEEFRYEAMVDRVKTVGTVFLGLTLECAQCHTHKYDPMTQREYFQFMAFMDNTDDVFMEVVTDEIAKERARIDARIDMIKGGLARKFPLPADFQTGGDENAARKSHLDAKFAAWKEEVQPLAADWNLAEPVAWETKHYTTLEKLPDRSLLAKGTWANTETYTVELRTSLRGITAMRIEALPHESLPGGGPGRGVIMSPTEGNFLLSEVALDQQPWTDAGAPPASVQLINPTHSYAEENRSAELTLDGKMDTGWGVLGKLAQPHAVVYKFAEPVDNPGGTRFRLVLDQYYVHQHVLGRFRVSFTTAPGQVKASGVPSDIENLIVQEARTTDEEAELLNYYLSIAPELADEHKKIAELEASKPKYPVTLALAERADVRTTLMRHRGEFLQPRDPVGAAVPAVLHPFPEHIPRNRITFAQWLVSRDNPLVARVTVNRIWQDFFGRGIVNTPEDFGVQGEPPTHPELLDWLAVEFVRRGWSIKELIRLIVLSSTYQQSSAYTHELLERDPRNDLLARMPRLRVKAELVRDIALASSGLLNPQIGGPSIYPPVPENLLALLYSQGPGVWDESKDAQRYRRGVYVYAKRILPYPPGLVFDQPARDTACVRRIASNTPLQALTLLNDTVFMESARALADRILALGGPSFPERMEFAFLTTQSRPPTQFEIDQCRAFLERQMLHFGENTPQAGELIQAAEQEQHNPAAVEKAAWTALARVLLNLDGTITKE